MPDPLHESSRIFVAGHRGLVGSALCRNLRHAGFRHLLLRTRGELDLCNQQAVEHFFETERPDIVFLAAARVGGILANRDYPAEFIYQNLAMETNVIHSAWKSGVKKLLFLGSSCVYPKLAPQPMREEYLLTSALEPTNQWYAIAKIAGLKLVEAYRGQYGFDAISIMPTNLYGPGDNFDLQTSHVLPALMSKFSTAVQNNAPEVTVWGTGSPRREFLHVDDLADACLFLMRNYSEPELINVGTGTDITIRELAEIIKSVSGFRGTLSYDTTKPDGTPRKLLDTSKLTALGWSPKIPLEQGIADTYKWYCDQPVLVTN